MSLSHYTRNILNIKDENIIFGENCLECKLNLKVHNCCAVKFVILLIVNGEHASSF